MSLAGRASSGPDALACRPARAPGARDDALADCCGGVTRSWLKMKVPGNPQRYSEGDVCEAWSDRRKYARVNAASR